MIGHCLLLLSVIISTLVQVNSQKDLGRLSLCRPRELTYQKFDLHIYSSSRNKAFRLIQNGSAIDFDLRRRTAVIVHGFMGNPRRRIMQDLGNQLLAWKNINVLHIDWSAGCSQIFQYYQAAVNVEYAAIQIKDFFKQLKKNWIDNGESLEDWGPLHFIGFSLGAHVVGHAAELLRIEENLLVDRVTGLDPAEFCFEDDGIPIRLSKKNARFVDVIHTDAARARNNAFGLRDPIGHADFYVNGGSIQPGCDRKERYFVNEYVLNIIAHMLCNGGCHHIRAAQVFTDSLEQATSYQCKYWAHPWNLSSSQAGTHQVLSKTCDASVCPEMGINADLYDYRNTETNTFYVATTSSVPYCARLN